MLTRDTFTGPWAGLPDAQVVPFFREVADAAGDLPLSIYETTRTKKALTLDQHRAIKETVPQYLMVKANAGTADCVITGDKALLAVEKYINIEITTPARFLEYFEKT